MKKTCALRAKFNHSKRVRLLLLSLGLVCRAVSGYSEAPRTFCNPLNINYRFCISGTSGGSYREAADPVVVTYEGDYYLFASHSGGYWWSKDFETWKFVTPEGLDIERYAPAILVSGKTMVYTSSQGGAMYQTIDPKHGKWTRIGRPFEWQDPALFRDDNGRVYCYFNCSLNGSIDGIELDPAKLFAPVGKPFTCFRASVKEHGFEVNGDNNEGGLPFVEGAWMNKINGTYYLQYAVPGTQYRSYCDGCYTSKSPRGPFTFMPSSPATSKPGGFVTGTGHGCLFQDLAGNWWKIDTMVVSVAHRFERRLAVFPAGIDKDGLLHANTELGDWPQFLPGVAKDPLASNSPNSNLLSFGKPVTVSSNPQSRQSAVDENIKTSWAALSDKPGEFLSVDLCQLCQVNAVQINFAEDGASYTGGRKQTFSHRYRLEGSPDGKNWSMLADKSENAADVPHDYIQLQAPAAIRHVRVINAGPMPGGGTFSIRDLRVFGTSSAAPPAAPGQIKLERLRKNEFLSLDLGQSCQISAVRLDFGASKPPEDGDGKKTTLAQRYRLEASPDGATWSLLETRAKTNNAPTLPTSSLQLTEPAMVRHIRVANADAFPESGPLSIINLSVLGPNFQPIAAPNQSKPGRQSDVDFRSVTVAWGPSPDAEGYLIRYGIAPSKLYNNYQVLTGTSQAINSLVVGQDYWFTVDAYNGGGVTKGATPVRIKGSP